MNNFRYKLTDIKNIEKKLTIEKINKNDVVVRPTYLSICQADKRYYFGKRDPKILNQKLPLCLIHEAIGIVTHSSSSKFKIGDRVILYPTIVDKHTKNENYKIDSQFMSSTADGFMQENVIMNENNLVLIDEKFDNYEIMVLVEILSCLIHAVKTCESKIKKSKKIVIYGDGNLGYLLHLYLLKQYKNIDIIVYGTDDEKLEIFSNEVETINIIHKKEYVKDFDLCFEVVGGSSTEEIINNTIEQINPTGTIVLLGVSENKVAINTRDVLQKGITLIGRSRSTIDDFKLARDFIYNEYEEVAKIIKQTIVVKNINDIHEAFNQSLVIPFKTVIKWEV